MTTNHEVLREALDQYVENLAEHVENQGEEATAQERDKLARAEQILEQLNAEFLEAVAA